MLNDDLPRQMMIFHMLNADLPRQMIIFLYFRIKNHGDLAHFAPAVGFFSRQTRPSHREFPLTELRPGCRKVHCPGYIVYMCIYIYIFIYIMCTYIYNV